MLNTPKANFSIHIFSFQNFLFMGRVSEKSFGARLAEARALRDVVLLLPDFVPFRDQESIMAFSALIEEIQAINDQETLLSTRTSNAIRRRQELFRAGPDSISAAIKYVRATVKAQYGSQSREMELLNARVNILRSKRRSAVAVSDVEKGGEMPRTASRSAQSYGSLEKHFSDMVETVRTFVNYKSSNPNYTLEALEKMRRELLDINTLTTTANTELKNQKMRRTELYKDLKDRCMRIKAAIKAQYGDQSPQYQSVKGFDNF